MISRVLFLISGLYAADALALRELPLINHQQTTLDIAHESMNRIAIREDRIKQIFGGDENVIIETDEDSGQIFIKPVGSLNTNVYLTLITEKGLTHDLKLKVVAQEAEPVLFYEKIETSRSHTPENQVLSFIKAMASGSCPENAQKLPLISTKTSANRAFGEHLKLTLVCQYLGETLCGSVCILKNESDFPLTLKEQDLSQKGDKAIALLKHTLMPQETTRLFIVTVIEGEDS